VTSIEAAGLANLRFDFDMPMKYGMHQRIGNTWVSDLAESFVL